jgi:hypothetical protein
MIPIMLSVEFSWQHGGVRDDPWRRNGSRQVFTMRRMLAKMGKHSCKQTAGCLPEPRMSKSRMERRQEETQTGSEAKD